MNLFTAQVPVNGEFAEAMENISREMEDQFGDMVILPRKDLDIVMNTVTEASLKAAFGGLFANAQIQAIPNEGEK